MTEVKIYFKKRANRNNIAVRVAIPHQGSFEVTTGLSTPKGSKLKIQRGRILVGSHPTVEDLNDKLYEFKSKVKDYVKRLQLINGEVTVQELKNAIATGNVRSHTIKDAIKTYIDDLQFDRVVSVKTSLPLARDTRRTRLSTAGIFLALSNRYYNIDLGKYNVGAAGVIGHSKVNKSFKRFYDSFIKVLHEEEYDANTVYGFVQEMKRIMRHVFGDSDIYIEPYFKHFVYQRNLYKRVLLSSDQYDFFVENYKKIRNEVKPSYRPFVDYWYVALFTCARHKDIGAWTESNLSVEKGVNFLNYTTSKGGVAISIPLKQEVLEIFKDNIDRGGLKLMVDVNNVSKTIKKVAMAYPIFCEPIVVERIKGGQKVTTTVPYWTMMTLHKMRGSGMTAMRRGNVPDHVIKQWSSHKENSEAFGAYFDTEKKELLDTAKSFYG